MNHLRICLTALLCLLLSSYTLSAGDVISKAESLYRAGKYDSAISLLEKDVLPALEAQHDTISLLQVWSILGCCHTEKGENQLAAKYCNLTTKALKYIGNDYSFITTSLYSIAQVYHKLGLYDEAIDYIDRSIIYETELNRPVVIAQRYIEKATIYYDKGDYEQAIENLDIGLEYSEKVTNRYTTSQIMYYKGLCLEALGDRQAAREAYNYSDFENHLGEDETYRNVPGLAYKLGEFNLAEGDTAQAVEFFRFAEKNSMRLHDYDCNRQALEALISIFAQIDPAEAAKCQARLDSLAFAPYSSELALKTAISGIEFPRREREQELKIEQMRFSLLAMFVVILAILAILFWYKAHSSRRVAEAERERAALLERELDQKQRLLALAETASDRALSQKVKQIAGELGDASDLTKREREICAFIAQGFSNKDIADRLNLSLRTVQTHRNTIYRKLGVTNTIELLKTLE